MDDAKERRLYGRALIASAILLFVLTYLLALWWHSLRIFGPPVDFLFDSDTESNLRALSIGEPRYELSHPLLEAIRIPVQLVGYVVGMLTGLPITKTAPYVGLAVSPASAAAAHAMTYVLLTRLRIRARSAFWLALGFAMWNSNLIFSLMPETYALSRLLLTVSLWALLVGAIPTSPLRTGLLGLAWTGVTVTNVLPYSAFLWSHRALGEGAPRSGTPWYRPWLRTMAPEVLRGITILGATLLIRFIWVSISPERAGEPDGIVQYIAPSIRRLASNFVQLIEMFFLGIVGPTPDRSPWGGVSYRHSPSLSVVPIYLGALVVMAIAIWGLFSKKLPLWLRAACFVNTAYNLALHTVFGIEGFLYVQHWTTTTFLLMVPAMLAKPRLSAAIMVLVTAVNLLNLYRIPYILPVGLS